MVTVYGVSPQAALLMVRVSVFPETVLITEAVFGVVPRFMKMPVVSVGTVVVAASLPADVEPSM